jgi:magnesium chelatase family protein
VNARLSNRQIEDICSLDETSRQLLNHAIDKFKLSARSYHRLLKLARSIADLNDIEAIGAEHVSEAIGYRRSALSETSGL